MKKLIVLLMLMPLLSFAQDAQEKVKPSHPKNEITLNTSIGFQPETDYKSMNNADLRLSIGYMRNFALLQAGVRFEMASDRFTYADYMPTVIINKKFKLHKSYLYAGTAVGYLHRNANLLRYEPYNNNMNGYVLGIQGGVAFRLSNSFCLTTELAVRSAQMWYKAKYYQPAAIWPNGSRDAYFYEVTQTQFILSFPVSVGVVYKF